VQTWTDGAVRSFEGHNEPSPRYFAAARSGQVALHRSVRGSGDLAGVGVVGASLVYASDQWNGYVGGEIDAAPRSWQFNPAEYADYGNWHPYPGAARPSLVAGTHDHVQAATRDAKMYGCTWAGVAHQGGRNRMIITEADYHTALGHGPKPHYPISELGQAHYVGRQFAEYFRMGYERVYAYELMDQGSDLTDPEKNFGWVRRDGSVKPAYTALKNLIALMADPGPGFTPGALGYQVTGGDADLRHLLFQKRDGSFWIMLWNDKSVWDRHALQDLRPGPQPVSITFDGPVQVTSFVPREGVAGSTVQVHGNQVAVSVPAEVMLLKVDHAWPVLP
jgi:hypothetical protein